MEAFADLLTNEDAGSFELHQKTLDAQGNEKYVKTDKEAVAHKARMTKMAEEVATECANQTFTQRIQWIETTRKKGNDLYRDGKYEEALNVYMTVLCALDFKTCSGNVTEEQDKMA